MTVDIDELELRARAATPGKWGLVPPAVDGCLPVRSSVPVHACTDVVCRPTMDEDAAFIAAANPEAVLELCAEVRRLHATAAAAGDGAARLAAAGLNVQRDRDHLRRALAKIRDGEPFPREVARWALVGDSAAEQAAGEVAAVAAPRPVTASAECSPANACATHGRCWTHSEWATSAPAWTPEEQEAARARAIARADALDLEAAKRGAPYPRVAGCCGATLTSEDDLCRCEATEE